MRGTGRISQSGAEAGQFFFITSFKEEEWKITGEEEEDWLWVDGGLNKKFFSRSGV